MDEPPETIADVLESLAARQPAAPAIHVPGRATLTYGHLGAQICYVRERLSHWGIQPGDIVGGALPSRPEMAVAIGTLPSSCTFAPLDPSLPLEAYAVLLTRMKARAVLVTAGEAHPSRAAARRLGIAEIEVTPERDAAAGLFTLDLGRGGSAPAAGNAGDRRLAYVLTSSGTTGRRKLVPAEEQVMLRYARAISDWLDFTPSDVGVHVTPMYFGSGLRSGLMSALLGGRSVVCLPEADIDAVFASIEQFRPTFLNAGFSLFQAILRRAPEFRAAVSRNRFRFMLSGSGRLDPDAADRLEQLFGAPMLTGLSSTETVRIAIDPLPPRLRKRGSVGLPLINEVAVLDSAGRLRPNGGPGEIVVRGPTVCRGYLDDPELTAASFAGGWFRTGDLGRIDEDGYVFFAGRIKEIINRGGEKISPAEIDLAIESLPGVREAAAFGIPHTSLGEEVVAAVVREDNAAVDEAQIIERVRARVGARTVPRRVYFVERLPRTDSGKLRRNALQELLSLEPVTAAARPAPGAGSLSPLEGALAGLWSSLLEGATVGRDDDFFLLGGDSLRGTQLIAHLKAIFGVDLSMLSLFGEAATVAGMARIIEAMRAGERAVDRRTGIDGEHGADLALRPRADRGPAALSHAQLRMWFLARLDPGSQTYNLSSAHRLSGWIDPAALQESLRAVVQRHDILRTTYAIVDEEPRQIVHATAKLDFEYLDLSATPAPDREDALLTLIDAEGQRPFHFETGPLARFRLIRLADGDHVLLRVWHHIVADGWSAALFEGELSDAYRARVKGEAAVLPALGLQYADYALWQRAWLAGAEGERQLGYWREQLKDLETLELPTDRARPAVKSDRGARLEVVLPGELVGRMRELGRAEGTTLFMTGFAAFLVLLHRYSGAEDIAVGTQISGRRRAELEQLMGVFLNALVLRGNLAGEPSFRELLGRVRARALAAYEHQDLPFERLVEELAPIRDLSRNPLFHVCFGMQYPGATLQLEGLQVSRLEPPRRSARFDLTLMLRETGQGLQASWEYCTDLFDASTIERMAGHFRVLIEAIVEDPEQRIGRLPLLTAPDRHQLLVEWNDTAADYPKDRCIHQLVEAQAERTPEAVAVAVAFEDQQLTYAELNARANQVAHHLIALGVGPEVLVGICVERSLEMVVGLLGILKAGGAYVPLDPSYPARRLGFMLDDTQAAVLLTQEALLAQLPPCNGHVLCLDRDWPSIAARPATDPPGRATAQNLAYVIYTSGSTGTPKGVAIEHRSTVAFLHWVAEAFSEQELAGTLFSTSVCFDLSVFELFAPLCRGGAVVVVGDVLQLAGLPDASRVTLINTVPSAMTALLRMGGVPESVRTVNLAGEPLPGPLARSTYALRHVAKLYNLYGPTEDTTYSTCALVARTDAEAPTIGRPIANTRVYVLDRCMSPVPIGVTGELYIGGDGLARGYLNRPELTAEKFLPDPFSAVPGARLYRTGDLARYLPDGNIEFLGRLDDQVKIRGFRIEPGEIEAVLAGHPAVRQAMVMAREDTPGDTRLVAYVVPTDMSGADFEPLRAYLRERLPDYMRPAVYVPLARLPLTPHGKVDRQALPAPDAAVYASRAYEAPVGEIEIALAQMWAEVLKIERVGRHDHFFELGGHSLLAVQVVSRIRRQLNLEIPLRTIFEQPTIDTLAILLLEKQAEADGDDDAARDRILHEVDALTDAEAAHELGARPAADRHRGVPYAHRPVAAGAARGVGTGAQPRGGSDAPRDAAHAGCRKEQKQK